LDVIPFDDIFLIQHLLFQITAFLVFGGV